MAHLALFYLHFRPPLRAYLMKGEFFVGSVIGSTLTKLALRYVDLVKDVKTQNVSLFVRYI